MSLMDKVPVQSRITTRPTLVDHSHNPEDAGEDLVAKDFFNILNQHDHKWTKDFLSMSPSLIGSVLASGLNQQGFTENLRVSETVGVVATTSAAPSAALGIMGAVGFTGNGITAGSLAALWQSTIGNVAAGSLFAGLQSMGAVGALTAPFALGVGAIPLAGYGIYKFATWKSPENRLQVYLNDPEWVEKIWQSKGL
ncbi:hypothetical protein FRC16_003194 [Serendipita sp. 398]|nr:hypothetical protein FRC16_003194 [Serendipita sp. 398]